MYYRSFCGPTLDTLRVSALFLHFASVFPCDNNNCLQMTQSFRSTCQQRVAEISFNYGKARTAIVENRSLLLEPEGHVDGNGDCSHRADSNERFDKLR